jgi:hypothetical protein
MKNLALKITGLPDIGAIAGKLLEVQHTTMANLLKNAGEQFRQGKPFTKA